MLMSVLFPAPFSPMSASTCPGRSSIETSSSARVAPKRFEIVVIRSNGWAGCCGSLLFTGKRPRRFEGGTQLFRFRCNFFSEPASSHGATFVVVGSHVADHVRMVAQVAVEDHSWNSLSCCVVYRAD